MITASSMVELKQKIYDANGWKRKRGESMSERIKALYEVKIDWSQNLLIARLKDPDVNK